MNMNKLKKIIKILLILLVVGVVYDYGSYSWSSKLDSIYGGKAPKVMGQILTHSKSRATT